jgi:L-2-hydroxyglutarate oxidase LhgO
MPSKGAYFGFLDVLTHVLSCYISAMIDVDVTVVGAGVVGLACAHSLAGPSARVVIVEKEAGPARHSSSRNSEVIHAGLYYPPGTLKANLCVKGALMLYEFCKRRSIAHRRIGKVVVAQGYDEEEAVESLWRTGTANGAEGLAMLTSADLALREPHVIGTGALLSPNTGIVDSHGLVKRLESMCLDAGCIILYRTALTAADGVQGGFICRVEGPDNQTYTFRTRVLVNSAGIWADTVAAMAGIDIELAGYRIHKVKGQYFRVRREKQALVNGLVYPAPEKDLLGLGIHATKDLSGSLRLGPDAGYVQAVDYSVDPSRASDFAERARALLPFLDEADLYPDTAGIRPKLQAKGGKPRDFEIRHEAPRGLPGLISLVGIESPGLTCCLAIAEHVKGLAEEAGLV